MSELSDQEPEAVKVGLNIARAVLEAEASPLASIAGTVIGAVTVYKAMAHMCGREENLEELLECVRIEWNRAFVRPEDSMMQ